MDRISIFASSALLGLALTVALVNSQGNTGEATRFDTKNIYLINTHDHAKCFPAKKQFEAIV